MATSHRPRQRERTTEYVIGQYLVGYNGDSKSLTLGVELENKQFPTEVGTEVEERLIVPPDGEPYLEIHPL